MKCFNTTPGTAARPGCPPGPGRRAGPRGSPSACGRHSAAGLPASVWRWPSADLPRDAMGLQPGEDTPYHRGGDGPARAAEQHGQLVLPPTRVLLPEVERRQRQLRRRGGLGYLPGAAAPSLQAREALGVVAAFLTAPSSGQKETGTEFFVFQSTQKCTVLMGGRFG